jgi:hypothetical protein
MIAHLLGQPVVIQPNRKLAQHMRQAALGVAAADVEDPLTEDRRLDEDADEDRMADRRARPRDGRRALLAR